MSFSTKFLGWVVLCDNKSLPGVIGYHSTNLEQKLDIWHNQLDC